MNEILQIIGSVASIASIPLAVYLYLRQKEAKYRRLRQEIARTLAYKIGEDSTITLFEVVSVIEAKSRDVGVSPAVIASDGIVEDLLADTISNPMLSSDRKRRVLDNLQQVHSSGVCFRILGGYSVPLSQALVTISTSLDMAPKEREELQRKAAEDLKRRLAKPTPAFEVLSTTFGVIAALTSVISLLVGTATLKNLVSWFQNNSALLGIILGALSSLVAGLVTWLISAQKTGDQRRERQGSTGELESNCLKGAPAGAKKPLR